MTSESDTIAACLTTPGQSAVAVIRVSGKGARRVLTEVFRPQFVPVQRVLRDRRLHLGSVLDSAGEPIDVGLAVFHTGPKSYTGEDVLEVHVHGNDVLVETLLEALTVWGCRLARPGEFTQRAFLNEKIDLVQAEAVMATVTASSVGALKINHRSLEGGLGTRLIELRALTVECLKWVELSIDFPEEIDGFDIVGRLESSLVAITKHCSSLIHGAQVGELISSGPIAVLVGDTNAGKSSLFNAMSGRDRAIVTEVPGTTRDVLEARMRVNGISLRLRDTAGLRPSEDLVEAIGVKRAIASAAEADILLHVVDAETTGSIDVDWMLNMNQNAAHILVINKVDLVPEPDMSCFDTSCFQSILRTSASCGTGIGELTSELGGLLSGTGFVHPEAQIVSLRQMRLLRSIEGAITKAARCLEDGWSEEAISIHLNQVRDWIDRITGTDSTDAAINAVFSEFCIGK